MKTFIYIALTAIAASSCSIARNYTMEDDIYYVPGKKSLVVKEVEKITGQPIASSYENDDTYDYEKSRSQGSSIPPADYQGQKVVNPRSGQLETVNMQSLATEAQEKLATSDSINKTIYENQGYWIGGYKGSESDLAEIQHIINLYPNGFAFFNSNGLDIAMNLSFDPDWNVYTYDGRYWWFPSYSNIELYSSLLMGTYPKYIWTVIWDDPNFDSWAFDKGFNWGVHVGWNHYWGWDFGWRWHYGWYDPWYSGWYDPWYGYWGPGYWGWHHPYWHDHWHDHWHHPGWNPPAQATRPSGSRPSYGGGVFGIRPGNGVYSRPGTTRRPQTGSTRPSTNAPSSTRQPSTGNYNRPDNSSNRPSTRPTVKSYSRPATNYRSTYNNNSRSREYTPTRNSYNRPTYTPPRNTYSRPTYTPSRSSGGVSRPTYTPSRSSGGVSRPAPTRPVRR